MKRARPWPPPTAWCCSRLLQGTARKHFARIGDLSDVDLLITDTGHSTAGRAAIERGGKDSGTRMIPHRPPPIRHAETVTFEVPSLDRGEVRPEPPAKRVDPGAQGASTSRATSPRRPAYGAELPMARAQGRALAPTCSTSRESTVAPVPVAGVTRSNIALAEADGTCSRRL
ncbi:hypothetical protein GCM10023238_15510 [Streptomyces heliomycini]